MGRLRPLTLVLWIAFAFAVNVFVPQLEAVIAHNPNPFLPESSPSNTALNTMDVAFGGAGAKSVAFVVLSNAHGLSKADDDYYRQLVDRLHADHGVTGVEDVISQPELKDTLYSKDGATSYIPVGLRDAVGSPEASAQIGVLRNAAATGRPADLQVSVTGLEATFTDVTTDIEQSIGPITLITIVLIGLILLIIYRSVVTTGIALATIGVALGTARGVTAFLGLHVFDVSTFTASFLTAVVLGAGTDYGVFLISRYHELRRAGVARQEAVRAATVKVMHVIVASAATVAAASACMALAKVGIFRTTGPAIAAGILVTLATALTVTPTLLAIAARLGWAEPPKDRGKRLWPLAGALVVRRPVAVLLLGVTLLAALAAAAPALRTNFDERAMQPADTESNRGYQALAAHFPFNEALPEYLVLVANHDLRNPRDLAALEQAASNAAKVPGVAQVRSVTRPLGTPIEAASLGGQAGQVGSQLSDAQRQVLASRGGADRLSAGAAQVATGADRLADGARQGLTGIDAIVAGLGNESTGLGKAGTGTAQSGDGARQLSGGARNLADGARQLATALGTAHDQTAVAVDGLRLSADALDADPLCALDPVCNQVRRGIRQIYDGENEKLLPGLARAQAAANALASGGDQLADGGTALANGLQQVHAGLDDARAGIDALTAAEQRLKNGMTALSDGATQVAGGANQVSSGTQGIGQSTQALSDGLNQAAGFLRSADRDVKGSAADGFYLPSGAINDPRLALARGYYLSPDGRTARFVVLDGTDPLGHDAITRINTVADTARTSLRHTSLDGAQVVATGPAAADADLDQYIGRDFLLVAGVAFAAVLLILVLVLRGLVAPIFVLLSVVLSYAAAIGAGVLVWQGLFHQDLEWTVPMITFVVLVAVGADYNILLMTRIREYAPDGARDGIGRAVSRTGGVITSAGVIFAASFLAMLSANVVPLQQIGFTIATGLLLDTFVVRTLVVPAVAALLGRYNWWPTGRSPRAAAA